jgi:putative addiction module component (TIGR02574 family)
MGNPALSDILQLALAERIQLVEHIWDSIAKLPEAVPVTEAQRVELDRRLAEHRRDPVVAIPWAEVRRDLSESL